MSSAARFLLLLSPRTTVAAFVPTDLPNLKEWLKADAGTWQDNALTTTATADGDPVGGWVDQSGAGKNALQGTTAAKPTLKLGANGIGGKAVLSFDGGDFLQTAAFAAALSQPNTIYFVFKLANNQFKTYYDGIGASNQHVFLHDGANPNKYSIYAGTELAGGTLDTSAHLLAVLFNGASSQHWLDNTSLASGAAGAQTLTGLTIGAQYDGTNNAVLLVAELIIYNAAHTPTQRGQVQTYLATRYGITLVP